MQVIFCNGQPKSGSSFFFQLVKKMIPHVDLNNLPQLQSINTISKIAQNLDGRYTGFMRGSIIMIAKVIADLPIDDKIKLVIKTHDANPVDVSCLPFPAVILSTFRDPIDVMVALKDQVKIERAKPADRIRPAFLSYEKYLDGFNSAAAFTRYLNQSFAKTNFYLEYPSFIRPSPEGKIFLSNLLGVDLLDLDETLTYLDSAVRSREIFAEFNCGEVGRGHNIIEQLVETGEIPYAFVEAAKKDHRALVYNVKHQGNGMIWKDE